MFNNKKMVYSSIITVVFLLMLTPLLWGWASGCSPQEPEEVLDTRSYILAFFENGWESPLHGSSLPSLKKNAGAIDIVSPFWFTIKMDGTIEDNHNQETMDFARENDMPVIALFNNEKDVIPSNDGMLSNPEARENSLTRIIELVDEYDYDGINIDFEIIPPKSRDLLTDYVTELAQALNSNNKTVDVSVFPRVGVPEELHGVYDYPALAEVSERFVIMTYNEHYPASDPGPVASIDWVRENIEDALNEVPKEKLVLGIAVYGYDWPGGAGSPETVEYIPMTEAAERAGREGVEVSWDDEAQSPYYNYTDDNGLEREVWYENANSIEFKLDLAREYDLPGIAIWRLGFEDNATWEVIR